MTSGPSVFSRYFTTNRGATLPLAAYEGHPLLIVNTPSKLQAAVR